MKRRPASFSRLRSKRSRRRSVAAHVAVYEPGSLILLLSPSQRQSQELFRNALTVYRQVGRPVPADAHTLAQTITAQGVRVMTVFRDAIVTSTPPQTIEGGKEATIHVHIRDADQLALEHTDGRRDTLITQLRLRAQPTNGPAVEWRWGESTSSPPVGRRLVTTLVTSGRPSVPATQVRCPAPRRFTTPASSRLPSCWRPRASRTTSSPSCGTSRPEWTRCTPVDAGSRGALRRGACRGGAPCTGSHLCKNRVET
jgi:hypothetical protein